jgi:excisionase family DNA binding protein
MSASKIEPRAAEPISVKVPEAVRLTGLSRSRIYELMRSGDIAYAKVGSSTLILVESLRAFVNGRRSSASAMGRDHHSG